MGLIADDWKFDAMAFIVVVLTSLYLYLRWQYSYWDRKGIETLPGLNYLFGHFQSMYTLREGLAEVTLRNYRASKEPFSGIYGFLRPILLVRDPSIIHKILIKDFDHFTDRGNEINADYDPLSAHLVNIPGHKWRYLRRKLSPTFTSGKLKSMFSTLIDCGSSLESYLQKVADKGDTLDVSDISARHVTNIIASVFFGIDVDTVVDPQNDIRKYFRRVFETTTFNAFKRLSRLVAPKFIRFLRIKLSDPELEDFIHSIIKQNLEYREQNNITRKDFFQFLIQLRNTGNVQLDNDWDTVIKTDVSQKKMELKEMVAHTFAFFGAGYETSAATISFCLYELAKNPEIQDRVRNEINTVLEKHNGQITYESVLEMKYLQLCMDETLRLYNVFVHITRKCVSKEYKIPGTDKIIEKGDVLIFPAFAIHRDEKYYPEPNQFKPDRFIEPNSAGKNQISQPYLPFGDGPRNCIGLRLGKMQIQVSLVTMLQKFRYELDDSLKDHDMEFEVKSTILFPREAIKLKLFRV